jgi:hypothetical protein
MERSLDFIGRCVEIGKKLHHYKMRNYTLHFLLSLVLSSAIFAIGFLYLSYYQSHYKAINVAHVSDYMNKEFGIKTTIDSFRKYKELPLPDNYLNENSVAFKLHKFSKSKDTINGYYIKLTEKTPHWVLVKSIDLCAKNKLDYLLDYNKIWILNVPVKYFFGFNPFCSTNLQY